jgi:hypothetical protein
MAATPRTAEATEPAADLYGYKTHNEHPQYWDVVPFNRAHPAHPEHYKERTREDLCNILLGCVQGINVDLGHHSEQHTKKFLKEPAYAFQRAQAATYAMVLAWALARGMLDGRVLHLCVANPLVDVKVHVNCRVNTMLLHSQNSRGKNVDYVLVAHYPGLLADGAAVGPEFHDAGKVRQCMSIPSVAAVGNSLLFTSFYLG